MERALKYTFSQSVCCGQNIWAFTARLHSECDSRFSYRRSKIRDQGSRVCRGYILDECTKVGTILVIRDIQLQRHVSICARGNHCQCQLINLQVRNIASGSDMSLTLCFIRHDFHFILQPRSMTSRQCKVQNRYLRYLLNVFKTFLTKISLRCLSDILIFDFMLSGRLLICYRTFRQM